jgi:hypothetical protein
MNNLTQIDGEKSKDRGHQPDWHQLVLEQVASLKFGTVQITVHNSRVVQIERLEKLRFDKPEPGNG